MHEALRRIVGEHVTQKGSLVSPERLRFDISHSVPLTDEQTASVEALVNQEIWANTEVCTRLMNVEEAMEAGAMALFGEKYEEEVRVLTMGREEENGKPYSIELCGGTHVRRTGDIGLFKLVSDSALSAGVRRLEGVTRGGALALLTEEDDILHNLSEMLNVSVDAIPERVKILSEEKRKLEKQVADLRRQLATSGGASSAGPEVKEIGGVKFTARVLDGFPPKDLKPMVDDLKQKLGSGVIALVATNEGKASIVVGVTDDLTGKISAVELVKIGAEALGGKGGGGRPDMAQAGGPDGTHANDAVSAIEAKLKA